MTSSAHQVPSRDTGGMSAGQAISRGPVKRSWSFPRVFGMRFNRQVSVLSPRLIYLPVAHIHVGISHRSLSRKAWRQQAAPFTTPRIHTRVLG